MHHSPLMTTVRPCCRYVEPMPFSIEPSYNDSHANTPLIFVLSAGSDPMASLLKYADDKGVRVEVVSLGQGQGPIAQEWISKGLKEGFWVVRFPGFATAAWQLMPRTVLSPHSQLSVRAHMMVDVRAGAPELPPCRVLRANARGNLRTSAGGRMCRCFRTAT